MSQHFYHSNSSSGNSSGFKPLEEYGIIGNLETCALIGADGSIDWLCLPYLGSQSVFGRLLDLKHGGSFSVRPTREFRSYQTYLPKTNILQTHFFSKKASAVLIDFMPPFKKRATGKPHQSLFRRIKCLKGPMEFKLTFEPRFGYGRQGCRLQKTKSGILAWSKKEKLFLNTDCDFKINGPSAHAQLTLKSGQEAYIILQYNGQNFFGFKALERELQKTVKFWSGWAHDCTGRGCVFQGPWHKTVVRSALVLKLLSQGETGAIAAAATTSLPEIIGGVRNWDYRFSWIRDSVFTVQALYNLGHQAEARALFNWYKRLYRGINFKHVKILNGLRGEKVSAEKTLAHWSGYQNSAPVRVGNTAAKQRQLDVYGELLNMAYETSRYGESISKHDWTLLKKIVNHVQKAWKQKDAGLWEVRSGYRHFVYSKVMCWVAVDRGIKIAEKKNLAAPLEKWKSLRAEIRQAVLKKGFNEKLNSFTQAFGSKNFDAANLLIPLVGFLPLQDYRVQGTIGATLKHLYQDGLVLRYRAYDGLPGKEGGFILCTYWLVDVLALSGKIKQAQKLYQNLLKLAGPLGLFAEEISLKTRRQLGNFPQAFSHIGLINSALYLGVAKEFYKARAKAPGAGKNLQHLKNNFPSVFKLLEHV